MWTVHDELLNVANLLEVSRAIRALKEVDEEMGEESSRGGVEGDREGWMEGGEERGGGRRALHCLPLLGREEKTAEGEGESVANAGAEGGVGHVAERRGEVEGTAVGGEVGSDLEERRMS